MRKIYIPDEAHTVVDNRPPRQNTDIRYVFRRPPRDPSYWLRPHPPRKKRPR